MTADGAMTSRRSGLVAAFTALLASCDVQPSGYAVASGPRDWTAHPAIANVEAPADAPIYAVSDVHGGYDRLVALLSRHGVIAASPSSPTQARWTAGHAVLVVAGDMIDKGPSSLEVLDLVMTLDGGARDAGGRVIATLGNHEAEFLADPENDKADAGDGIDPEARAHGVDVMALASGRDPRGAWLRGLPFGARVGRWFFSHAGNTAGRTVAQLEGALRAGVVARDYRDTEVIGDASILEARAWWTTSAVVVSTNARALDVDHFVFGHSPSALGARGQVGVAASGGLFRIDCGMSPGVDDSRGALLRVRVDAGREVAESLAADGSIHTLWRGA